MTEGRESARPTADQPTSPHTARYHPGNSETEEDGRLHSAVFPRNSPPLIAALSPWIGAASGRVLEIGCGTGQHAGAFDLAFAGIEWWASDPDPLHRASAAAWRAFLRLPPREALALDAARDWAPGVLERLGPLSAVFSANVIHIAPPEVMHGILRGAGKALAPGGLLFLYGPFKENGAHTGPGNAAFDAGLRAENPAWGLRDIRDLRELAAAEGLAWAATQTMPADNRLLVFRKQP